MRQVTGRHQEILIADPSHAARRAAPMNRHVLTNHVFPAQNHTALGGGIKSQVLWFRSDHRPTSYPRPLPYYHMPDDLRMRLNLAPGANFSRTWC